MIDEIEERKRKIISKFKDFLSSDQKEYHSEEKTEVAIEENDPELLINLRKDKIIKLLNKSSYIYYLFLIPILALAYYLRTRNLQWLQGKYLLGLDPWFFYRYSNYIIENGTLFAHDSMRYYPVGYPTAMFKFISYTLAYLYKFFHVFKSSMTVLEWHIIYPPILTILSLIFFFLFVKKLFDGKVALVSTAFLAVMPGYIYRTGAGFADHEALAMFFMFGSLYFFSIMWDSKRKLIIPFGALSGLFAGMMAATWGGVRFLTVSIAIFVFLALLFTKFNKNQLLGYFSFYILYIISASALLSWNLTLNRIYDIDGMLLTISLLSAFVLFIIKKYENKIKLFERLPAPIISLIITSVLVAIPAIIIKLININQIKAALLTKGLSRFETTVSESMQPFFKPHWWGDLSWSFFLIFLGSVFIFYKIFSNKENDSIFSVKDNIIGIILTIAYIIFFSAFIFGRYSRASIQSGLASFFSSSYLYWFIGFITITFLVYIYLYNKDKEIFSKIFKEDWHLLLVFTWFLLSLLIARGSNRLIFALIPPSAVMIGYFIINSSKEFLKSKYTKIVAVAIILFALFAFYNNADAAYNINLRSGSGLPGQWEASMNWIRDNTLEDAVIGHWWDYGYWTQTIGNRASVGDGGNMLGVNHLLGRQVMTGRDPQEYIPYMKTHNISHILYSRDEIGKYWAYSFIGSDENLDRASTIGIFSLQNQQEIRNGTRLAYGGGWILDQNIIAGRTILTKDNAIINGLTVDIDEEKVFNPKAYIYQNGNQYEMSVNCVCVGGDCYEFEDAELDSCITIIPYIQSQNQGLPAGAAIYTSEKVRHGLFARLYIQNEEIEYFKEVYNDGTPLALFQGNLVGPIRIWEVQYPDWVETDDKWLEEINYKA